MVNKLFFGKMNKKGISPLIATLLLISFAVALGVVIMNFGRAQVELEAQCPIDVGLKLATISGGEEACYSATEKKIKFTLENGVNIKVEGLVVSIIAAKKAESYELNDAKLIKAGNYMGGVSYSKADKGEIRQIKITPKVILYDEEQICVEQALVVENIKDC
jgi:flagellin-like protein